MANAAYVTKYDAGGTGDNLIPDGFIKTVEKVWMDYYTFAAAIPSNATIDIAVIPQNKKITSIELFFPALSTGAAATGTTISIGVRAGTTATGSTLFLSAFEAAAGVYYAAAEGAEAATGLFSAMTGTTNRIYLQFGRIATTTTAGTIKTIVRYT
jgi:hypothetical protein